MNKGKENIKKVKKVNKKCSSCSLNCVVVRAIAVEGKSEENAKKALEAMFGDEKPIYDRNNCPKR